MCLPSTLYIVPIVPQYYHLVKSLFIHNIKALGFDLATTLLSLFLGAASSIFDYFLFSHVQRHAAAAAVRP